MIAVAVCMCSWLFTLTCSFVRQGPCGQICGLRGTPFLWPHPNTWLLVSSLLFPEQTKTVCVQFKLKITHIREGECVSGMNTLRFQVVFDVSFGHEREHKVRVAFGSVETYSQQTHYVGVVKSPHQKTLLQQWTKLLFAGQIWGK